MKSIATFTTLFLILISVNSYADVVELTTETRTIPSSHASKEEIKVLMNEYVATLRNDGIPEALITNELKDWQTDIDNGMPIYSEITSSDIVAIFPELASAEKLNTCLISITDPATEITTYHPKVLENNKVLSRVLRCQIDLNTSNGKLQTCQFRTRFRFFANSPLEYFNISGEIEQQDALKIAEIWNNKRVLAGEKAISVFDSFSLKGISKIDDDYEITFGKCACSGSVQVRLTSRDGMPFLRLLTEPSASCI
jgi:hypothetical protein